ncbi:MAG: efflux RND transporter periplasmic adaptor subunit [Magnetococcales bacterium]|nr:efflux RND transporter periplasmic adaptor subunit [Magnetococcales bacterium]
MGFLAGLAGFCPAEAAQGKGTPLPPPAVKVATAQRRAVPVEVRTIGHVKAPATVAIRPRLDAEIVGVFVADGAMVKEGDRLFALDAREVENRLKLAQANLARDRAALVNARRLLERQTRLASSEVSSPQNLDKAKADLEMLEASIVADEAQLDSARLQRSYTELRSPLAGRVGAVSLQKGNIARTGEATPLLVIHQMQPIHVSFALPQLHLPALRSATEALPVAVTIPGDGRPAVLGKLAFINHEVSRETGTVTLEGVFANGDERLWPGQLVDVTLVLRTDPQALVVPTEAVSSGQNGPYVFVVESEVATPRPVRLDRVHDGLAVIGDGLREGETVVIDGQFRLTGGMKVTLEAPVEKKPVAP